MFLLKKKSISSGVVARSTCCGIWEGENHLINRIKTLYRAVLQVCCQRRSSSVLALHWHAIPLPTLNQNSTEKAKSGSWLRYAANHWNCLGRNCLLLIILPCHPIAEFGGTETLWLRCPTYLLLPAPLQIRPTKSELCSLQTSCQKSYARLGNQTLVSHVAGKNSTTETLMQHAG